MGVSTVAEEIFLNYRRLAIGLARMFAKGFPDVPYDDLRDEALSYLGLVAADWLNEKARKPEGPGRTYAGTTTWVNKKLYFHLLTFASRKQPRAKPFSRCDVDPDRMPAREEYWVTKFCRSLGEDARIVVQTIFFGPAELIAELNARAKARMFRERLDDPDAETESGRAAGAVNAVLDWDADAERIMRAWSEIEAALAADAH